MNVEQDRDRLIRDFCKSMGMKAKKYQSPKHIAYQLLVETTKNRRGSRSINQYLDDHAEMMRAHIKNTQSMNNLNEPA